MLQYRTVSPATLELLKGLSKDAHLSDFFLVGGTSLSLQIGHRESYDLDFFTLQPFSTDQMMQHLRLQWGSEMLSTSEHILITMTQGVKVDFVVHPYPIRNSLLEIDGLRLLHREDIALMKIAAIAGRGRKRDFFDLYYLLREFPLPYLFDCYSLKYGEASVFHALRSLTYFDDAEGDADPILFEDISWAIVKKRIQQEAVKI
ncbi:MAG: nucleotidyl transferase AbiEii/AbiGii toxin family protein [Saprospiraceae bacterium]